MMVVRRRPGKAILGPEVVMFGGVGVAGQAERVRPAGNEFEEVGTVDGVGGGLVRSKVVAQRNMHAGHDELVGGKLLENIGDEGQLPLVDAAFVLPATIRLGWIEAEIVHVIEHQKENAS